MGDSVHSDTYRTVRVSSRRFERSPFQDRWETPDTVMGVYAGRYYSAFNGEDVNADYWALRRTAVLYDVPERPVEISGPDAEALLERVFSRRVGNLKEGRGRYALACTPRGGVFMDGILFRLDTNRFWYVQPDGALEAWLLAHCDGLDVQITDPHSRVLQIQGPASPAILKQATRSALDERMGYFHSGFFDIAGQRVYVSRTGWTGELGYEVYTQGDATDCGKLWDFIVETGKAHDMVAGSNSSMAIRRIEAGILDSGTDFDMTMTPFAAGLGAFVDMDKADFVGCAALRDADRRTRLYGLKCPSSAPGYRCALFDDDRIVGHVTAGAWSPYLQMGIGYARFQSPGEWAGRNLSVVASDGRRHACDIVELPFFDKDKLIPRGLAKMTV